MWLPLGDWFFLSECSKCKHTVGCPFCPWFSTGELTPQGCCQWKKQEDVRSGQAAIGDCIQRWCWMWYLIHELLVVLKALVASTASLRTQQERLWTIISLELLSVFVIGISVKSEGQARWRFAGTVHQWEDLWWTAEGSLWCRTMCAQT